MNKKTNKKIGKTPFTAGHLLTNLIALESIFGEVTQWHGSVYAKSKRFILLTDYLVTNFP